MCGSCGWEHTKRFDTKRDAERWLREKSSTVDRGEWVNPTYGRMAFEDWAGEWWKLTSDLRPSSRARDLSYLRTHVLPRFGPVPLGSGAGFAQIDAGGGLFGDIDRAVVVGAGSEQEGQY